MLKSWVAFSGEIQNAATSEFNEPDLLELYKELFNKFDGINYQRYEKAPMSSLVNSMAKLPLSQWPKDTSIMKSTPQFSLEYFQTPVTFQSQAWMKVDKNGSLVHDNMGLIEIELPDLKRFGGCEFVLKNHDWEDNLDAFPNFKKVVTENEEFNSKFELYSNDQIEVRVLFTPYCFEKMLNFQKQDKEQHVSVLPRFVVCKFSNKILIYFSGVAPFLFDWGFDSTKANPEYIVNDIANKIMMNCYQVYAALSMAFLIPMF